MRSTSAVDILIKATSTPDTQTREAVVRTLGYLGSGAKPAEAAIRRLAKSDPQTEIRATAENAPAQGDYRNRQDAASSTPGGNARNAALINRWNKTRHVGRKAIPNRPSARRRLRRS